MDSSKSNPFSRGVEAGNPTRTRPVRPSRVYFSWPREDARESQGPAKKSPTLLGDLVTVCLLFLIWRGLLFGADMVGRAWSQPFTTEPHHWVSGFWDGYIRHDSFHLRYIIREGYRLETEGTWKGMSTNAAFFPLYPYTVKALTTIPGYGKLFRTVFPPGLILSNVSLLLAMAYMLRIARMSLDEDGARRSLVYLLAYPTSFFFSCFYTEGLFLLTVTASCYHFLNGRHFRCGAWGLLAAMTRSPGIMLLPAFLLGHLWERRGKLNRSDFSLLWLGLIPCGLAAVMGILYLKLGDPFAFSKAHSAWNRTYMPPYLTLWNAVKSTDLSSLAASDLGAVGAAIDLVSSIVFLVLPFFLLRGFHKALPIYTFLMVLMPLSTGSMMSMTRCELVAFPGFFALAKLGENREVDRAIVFGSGLLLALMKVAFSKGWPIF